MNDKPWVKKYDRGVPENLIYPDITIQELLTETAFKTPDRRAVVLGETAITYQQLLEDSTTFAMHLIALGIQKGDRVGISLPNSPEFVIAYYGTLLAGGIVAAINPGYPQREMEFQANVAELRILIGQNENKQLLANLLDLCKIEKLILLDGKTNTQSGASFETSVKIHNFASMLRDDHLVVSLPQVSADEPAVFQFSGGTTGTPKAAVALHRNVVANTIQFKSWLSTMEEGKESFLTAIPLYHVYGMVIGLNVGVAMGATIHLNCNPRDLGALLEQIQANGITFFPGVPSMYHAIAHFQPVVEGKYNLRSIKACISGSAPLLEETKIAFESLTGGKLVEGYGLSEAPTATHCNPIQGENRKGSIGLPLPDVECKIVNIEDRSSEMPTGESGELLIRGPQIMHGYYKQPKETQMVLKDGWLHTGDAAKMDKDGYFYVLGRLKELIKVGGLQVWPKEVEDVLGLHPSIREVAVAGIADPACGEYVRGWIVLRDGEKVDLSEIQQFCRPYLVGYKIPREVEVVEVLPRSPVGKILRRELIGRYLETKKTGA